MRAGHQVAVAIERCRDGRVAEELRERVIRASSKERTQIHENRGLSFFSFVIRLLLQLRHRTS